MNFQAIRNARKAAGVTQEQLAEVLGINRATLSKYETGVIEPSVSQLKTIAAALRIDFYVLANETNGLMRALSLQKKVAILSMLLSMKSIKKLAIAFLKKRVSLSLPFLPSTLPVRPKPSSAYQN